MRTKVERPGARWWVPERPSLLKLRSAVQECQGCELHLAATQGVMGTGNADADLMVVGEQPGQGEDRTGEPFVGPVRELLETGLAAAGIDLDSVYFTNVVKHFRFHPSRGQQRIHRSPSRVHVAACSPWLLAELEVVRPRGVVLLGGTAGKALYGPSFRVGRHRGRLRSWPEELGGGVTCHRPEWVLATAHPAAVLNARDREADQARFVADLRVSAQALGV